MIKPTRTLRFPTLVAIAAGIAFALTGCSQQAPSAPAAPSASAQAAANEAAAAKDLKLYRDMLAQHADGLAAPVGEDIVKKYPGTAAAAEVQKTLAQVAASAKAKAEHDRLANMWSYQIANVGGIQSTASMYSNQPTGAAQVRLILRVHAKWLPSAYLMAADGSKGFVCKGNCDLVMHVDGKREVWKAYLPQTGHEPALFIKGYKRFLATLQHAKVITMDVTTRDRGKETLKFEVGGFDRAQYKPLPQH